MCSSLASVLSLFGGSGIEILDNRKQPSNLTPNLLEGVMRRSYRKLPISNLQGIYRFLWRLLYFNVSENFL
jgi:hypothetical protein